MVVAAKPQVVHPDPGQARVSCQLAEVAQHVLVP